jgi:hypothetical protein
MPPNTWNGKMSSFKENDNGLAPMKTPTRRAVSAEPVSIGASFKTPVGSQGRASARSQRYGLSASGRKLQAETPHGRQAIRTLDSRRAAILTPHRNRRKSAREQRETPRDFLRGLSKALAPTTRRVTSSSSPALRTGERPTGILREVLEEDELPIDKPRLSLPIDEDEDDSDLQPPRSAGLEEENFTIQSVELPRRAFSEQPPRLSGADIRMSDLFGRTEAQVDGDDDSAIFSPIGLGLDGDDEVPIMADDTFAR